MTSVEITQHVWPYLRWPVTVAYLWWALVWGTVAYYYLSSARREHRLRHPHSRRPGLLLFVDVVWRMATKGLTQLWRGQFNTPVPPAQHNYPSGTVLQFGIVCSALCSALFGLTLFGVDRSSYGVGLLTMTVSAVMLSTVGGMIHLYPPLHHKIAIWRTAMLFSWLGVSLLYGGAIVVALV